MKILEIYIEPYQLFTLLYFHLKQEVAVQSLNSILSLSHIMQNEAGGTVVCVTIPLILYASAMEFFSELR